MRARNDSLRAEEQEIIDLCLLGWKASHAAMFEAADPGLIPLRIAVSHGNRAVALGEEGEHSLELPGSFMRGLSARGIVPVTGDWVLAEPIRLPGGAIERDIEGLPRAAARELLPRQTDLSRKVAGAETVAQPIVANVDRVFIVTAPGSGNRARIAERYLVVVRASGSEPVILLNKIDLVEDAESGLAELAEVARGARVIGTSALRGDGIEQLRALAGPGETVALVGKSGVGKSALVNALVGEDRQATGAVNDEFGKGRHTTTRRELVPIPGGGILVDTPGMRELQLWGDSDMLEGGFDDIAELAESCRFSDCRHKGEPGCAVAEALEDGRLGPERWESYRKMRRELAILEVRKDQRSRIKIIEKVTGEFKRERWNREGKAERAAQRSRRVAIDDEG